MTYLGWILAAIAATGTYLALASTEFGPLAVIPAFFVGIVVLAPFAPKLT